ncbi:MAG: hypothetical protein H7Z14_01420 [Anaerolineae bacterium]|nr:hypothetical protein [Phycisphaerae bacterium]
MFKSLLMTVAVICMIGSSAFAFMQEHKHGQGEKHKLGRKAIGDYTVSVNLIGEIEPGGHVDFDIKLIDAKSDPKALRVWIGTEDGSGAKKAEGKKGQTTYTGEVDVPKPLPQGAKLWVELETDAGVKRASYELEEHGHKH